MEVDDESVSDINLDNHEPVPIQISSAAQQSLIEALPLMSA